MMRYSGREKVDRSRSREAPSTVIGSRSRSASSQFVSSFWGSVGRPEGSRQVPFEAAAYLPIAFTSRLLETGPIHDRDPAPALRDETGDLESARHETDGGPLDPQHRSQELVRQAQVVLTDSVMRGENPPAAARFDPMDGIAGHYLKCLRQQSLRVTQKQLPNAGPSAERIAQRSNGYS